MEKMDKFDNAIELFKMGSRISQRNYGQPIVVTYSGGKDSDALLEVAKASGEMFEVINNHTTVDAPQTVYHIRKKFRKLELKGIKCEILRPDKTMWDLIVKNGVPPTRRMRYCCVELKERSGENRMIATGVRWQESTKQKSRTEFESADKNKDTRIQATKEMMLSNDNSEKRKIIEHCRLMGSAVCNPIIAFKETEVWEVLNEHKIEVNPLYSMGYDRVGCIGCPLAGKCKRIKEFADFPKYKDMYIRAFDKMLEVRKSRGKDTQWKTGEEVFLWWMEDDNIEGQLSFDYENERISENLIDNY